jgi:uncharacterized protein
MNTIRSLFSALSVLVVLAPAVILADAAGDFQKGIEAYRQGKSSEAAKWFRKAADQGNAKAQHVMGMAYFEGQGVIKDAAEAVKWYRKAADQGYANA